MLLPLLIPILCALLFVILYKRPVNASSVISGANVPIDPPATRATPVAPVGVPAPVVPPPPAVEVPMNFNDIFAAKPSTKSDRPGV